MVHSPTRELYVTTIPDGVAFAGPAVGDAASSVSVPSLTEKALIVSLPPLTTQSVEPSGDSRASSGPLPLATGVLPIAVRLPSTAIE